MHGVMRRTHPRWPWLAAGIAAGALVSPLAAQPPGAVPPPPPVPAGTAGTYRPGETYDALKAGQDAYRWAESERLAQIARQLQLEDRIRRMNTGLPPRPLVPGIGGYPYSGAVAQPTGHEKIWTGPNSYVYRPRWDLPVPPSPPSGRAYPPWPGATVSPPASPPPRVGEIPPPPLPRPPAEPPADAPLPPTAKSL
jgi:hypothetical protein